MHILKPSTQEEPLNATLGNPSVIHQGPRIPFRRLIHQNVSYSRYAAISLMLISSAERLVILPFSGYWGAGGALRIRIQQVALFTVSTLTASCCSLPSRPWAPSAMERLVLGAAATARQLGAFSPLPSLCVVSELRELSVSVWLRSRCSDSPTGPGTSDECHSTSRRDAHCATPCVETRQAHMDSASLKIPGPENATSLLRQRWPFRASGSQDGRGSRCTTGGQAGQRLRGHHQVALSPEHQGPALPSLKQSSLPGHSGFQHLSLSNTFRNDLKSQKSRASLAEMHNEWPVSRSGEYMVDKETNDGQTARDEPDAGAGRYPWTGGRGVLVPWCH